MKSIDDYTSRCVRAAQILKANDEAYFADVIRNLMASELRGRRAKRKPRKKRVTVARNGIRVRGGAAYITLGDNVEIVEG